jgi:hypothetical protein
MHSSLSRILPGTLSILFACAIIGAAQETNPKPLRPSAPLTADMQDANDKETPTIGSMEEEMRAKRRIKLEEKEYRENLDRAREADRLSSELRNSYEQKKSFTREDTKKLERLEKLTRRIRSDAGGSDEDTLLDNPPHELQPALSRLAQVTEALRKVVEKTPRQVISATVIQEANTVLQLVKIARNLFH